MSDSEHADALSATGFWGRAAAGCLVMARDTGRLLVPLRSEGVLEPGTWGTWGGAIDTGEEPSHAVLRELVEETGLDRHARVDLHPLMVFESGSFRYHNFLAVVDREFVPEYNWETADSMWVSIDAMPAPLHPGLRALLADAESMKTIRAAEFQRWFAGSAIAKDGVPQVVYHGTTAIKVIPGQKVDGDREAAEYLRGVAAAHGIAEASGVASIFERWLEMGVAAKFGVTPELAAHVRAMYERSKPTITRPVEDLGFDVFEMPGGGKELGVHFGSTRTQAEGFGTVFEFYLSMRNPLRMPDLGTWGYQSVIREARKLGVDISEAEYDTIFNARDENSALREVLMQKGYDGVVYANEAEGRGDSYIAFDPGQIRRADPEVAALASSVVYSFAAQPSNGSDRSFESATPESVKASIAEMVRCTPEQFAEGVGNLLVTTSDELALSSQEAHDGLREWFGASQVTGHDGEPLVVYHGTGGEEEFASFRASESGWYGRGIYFTSDASVADEYSLNHDEGQRIMPVYLKMERPYYYREPRFYERRASDEANFDMIRDVLPKGRASRLIARLRKDDSPMLENELVDELQKMGHDGIIVESSTSKGCEYIVFDPAQVKSAIGNRGTYDPRDPDIRHSLAAGAAGLDPRAQAFHDVATNTTVFLADRIPAGKEASVFLHETVHRHGRQALPEGRWGALVGQVKAWAQAEPQSAERAIHDAAAARVATAGVAGAVADEELFAYAVEEAVAMGIEPTAAAVEGSAEAWLQVVVESIQRVTDKLLGNDLQDLSGQDLVDLAYALAQLDSPEHGLDVRRALAAQGSVSVLSGLDSISGAIDLPGVHADVVAERGKFVSIYGWSGDGSGRTRAALRALVDFGGVVVVHDPGEPGTESRAYWQRMFDEHLVQELRSAEDEVLCSSVGTQMPANEPSPSP